MPSPSEQDISLPNLKKFTSDVNEFISELNSSFRKQNDKTLISKDYHQSSFQKSLSVNTLKVYYERKKTTLVIPFWLTLVQEEFGEQQLIRIGHSPHETL